MWSILHLSPRQPKCQAWALQVLSLTPTSCKCDSVQGRVHMYTLCKLWALRRNHEWRLRVSIFAGGLSCDVHMHWSINGMQSGHLQFLSGKTVLMPQSLGIMDETEEVDMCLWWTSAFARDTLHLNDFITKLRKWIGPYPKHMFWAMCRGFSLKMQSSRWQTHDCVALWLHRGLVSELTNRNVMVLLEEAGSLPINLCCNHAGKNFMLCSWEWKQPSWFCLCFTGTASYRRMVWWAWPTARLHVSDGASVHFKNKSQAYEMGKNPHVSKWLFSVPVHGKKPCSGVDGLVKHMETAHNLSRRQSQPVSTNTCRATSSKGTQCHSPAFQLWSAVQIQEC